MGSKTARSKTGVLQEADFSIINPLSLLVYIIAYKQSTEEVMGDVTQKMTEAEKVIFAKYINTFPFPIVEFINEIGINIHALEDAPENMSGAITKKDGKYFIYVNTKHQVKRMRFTLAHELAHYFNDKEYLESNGEIKDTTKHSQKWLFRAEGKANNDPAMRRMDVRANKFAADLLMPEAHFVQQWLESSNVESVANHFGVSADAVKIRAACVIGEII